MKACSLQIYERDCPLIETHDKFIEAWYFLTRMVEYYHRAKLFRWYLDAFIQSLRNVTFMLQSEGSVIPDFKIWYKQQQQLLREDVVLVNFKNARNILVKEGMLRSKSTMIAGIFHRAHLKIGIGSIEVDLFTDSIDLLEKAKSFCIPFMLDKEHSALDEQIGVQRKWVVADIGDEEISLLCYKAWRTLGLILESAHLKMGLGFQLPTFEIDRLELKHILLESDLDEELPKKWGWINE